MEKRIAYHHFHYYYYYLFHLLSIIREPFLNGWAWRVCRRPKRNCLILFFVHFRSCIVLLIHVCSRLLHTSACHRYGSVDPTSYTYQYIAAGHTTCSNRSNLKYWTNICIVFEWFWFCFDWKFSYLGAYSTSNVGPVDRHWNTWRCQFFSSSKNRKISISFKQLLCLSLPTRITIRTNEKNKI